MAVISTVLVPSVLRPSLIVNVDPVAGHTEKEDSGRCTQIRVALQYADLSVQVHH